MVMRWLARIGKLRDKVFQYAGCPSQACGRPLRVGWVGLGLLVATDAEV